MEEYCIHLAILCCIYLILAHSFNISFGLAGLLNLAHIATYAIGAYTYSILTIDYGYHFVAAFLLSGVGAALFSVFVGAIAARLRGDYFALGSLGFYFVVSALLINWREVTRGVLGIAGVPRPELLEIDFYENRNFLVLAVILCLGCLACMYLLQVSPFGRLLRAQSENEFAAMSLGRDVARARNLSFLISSAFAGFSGAIFASYLNYVDPSSFSLTEMILVLSMVVVGRPGSFWGVTLSTIFLVLLPEPLRFLDFPPSAIGPLRQIVYSAILVGVVYWRKEALFPRRRVV
ncbi:MAG: branched-chain amino acid ABC transporter permease [Bdellovibrionales bacterium]|nr:branched-chain amino acid ABC transporter permease [Bdellovibrionales bacterium]